MPLDKGLVVDAFFPLLPVFPAQLLRAELVVQAVPVEATKGVERPMPLEL